MANSNEEERLIMNEAAEYGSLSQSPAQQKDNGKDKRFWLRYSLIALALSVLSVLVFVLVSAAIVVPNAQEYVNQSVEFDIRQVELESINTEGVFVRVGGINKVDYKGIESDFASSLLKLGGGLLKVATIHLENVQLETFIDVDVDDEEEDKERELVNIGNVKIPEFEVNIGDGQITILDLLISLQPDTRKVLKLIKNLIQHPDKIFRIYGSTKLNVNLGSRFLPINGIKLNFETEIVGNNYFQIKGDEIEISDLSVNELENKGYDIGFELSLPNPLYNKLISFKVPTLQWELFINDCFDHSTISLFDEIQTEHFKISTSKENLKININALLNDLNPELSVNCKIDDDDYSPLNHLIDQFLSNEAMPLMVQNSKGSEDYPNFINEILTNLQFNVDYVSNFKLSELVESVSMNNLKFEFANGNVNKPIINGEIEIVINLPINSTTNDLQNLKISKIRGDKLIPIKLFHEVDEEFGEINFVEWHDCENEFQDDNKLVVTLNLSQEELTITNKSVFGKVVNEILYGGKSNVLIDAVMDCLIDTLVGDFQFSGINIHSESEITRGTIFN